MTSNLIIICCRISFAVFLWFCIDEDSVKPLSQAISPQLELVKVESSPRSLNDPHGLVPINPQEDLHSPDRLPNSDSDNQDRVDVLSENSSEELGRSMGANVLLISYLKQPRKSNTILNSVMIQTIKYSYDSYHDEEPRRTQFFYEYVMILSDIRTQELVMDLTYSYELAYHGNNELEVALCIKKSIKDTKVLTWVNNHFNRGPGYTIKKLFHGLLVKPCCLTPSKWIGRFLCHCETGKEWILTIWTFGKGLVKTTLAYYDVLVDLMFVLTLRHVSNKVLVSNYIINRVFCLSDYHVPLWFPKILL